MARKRMIDPSIWDSRSFKALSSDSRRLAFIRLFSSADDEGKERSSILMGYCRIKTEAQLQECCNELEAHTLVYFYKVKDGLDVIHYYQIPKWFRWQRIDHPTPSRIPNHPRFSEIVPEDYQGMYSAKQLTETNRRDNSSLSKDKLKEEKLRGDSIKEIGSTPPSTIPIPNTKGGHPIQYNTKEGKKDICPDCNGEGEKYGGAHRGQIVCQSCKGTRLMWKSDIALLEKQGVKSQW